MVSLTAQTRRRWRRTSGRARSQRAGSADDARGVGYGYAVARHHAESEAGDHRPSPRDLRRSSPTHWPAWRVLSYVLLELVAVALVILGLFWLLTHS